jgi:hypothetical protein
MVGDAGTDGGDGADGGDAGADGGSETVWEACVLTGTQPNF